MTRADRRRASERRRHPRLSGPFPAIVRSAEQTTFRAEAAIDNISAGGLYMRLARTVEAGARLLVVVQFSATLDSDSPAPRFALRGVVQRVERQPDGTGGVALRFTRHRPL